MFQFISFHYPYQCIIFFLVCFVCHFHRHIIVFVVYIHLYICILSKSSSTIASFFVLSWLFTITNSIWESVCTFDVCERVRVYVTCIVYIYFNHTPSHSTQNWLLFFLFGVFSLFLFHFFCLLLFFCWLRAVFVICSLHRSVSVNV